MMPDPAATEPSRGHLDIRPRHPIQCIDIALFDCFDEPDTMGPYEVPTNTARAGAPVEVRQLGPERPGEVRASHEVRMDVDGGPEPEAELVLVPGGGWNAEPRTPGSRVVAAQGVLPAALTEINAAGLTIAPVCTGAMIIAAAGPLNGRTETTHRVAVGAPADPGARVVEERVVDAGDVVTAGGVTSGIDLALWLVERERGRALANAVALRMEHQPVGEVMESG
jgi:transcriptional regulator GlxA family with amidase domain